MKVYAVAEFRGYDGTYYEKKMYTSKAVAEAKAKELNIEKAEENEMTVEELFEAGEEYAVVTFELE